MTTSRNTSTSNTEKDTHPPTPKSPTTLGESTAHNLPARPPRTTTASELKQALKSAGLSVSPSAYGTGLRSPTYSPTSSAFRRGLSPTSPTFQPQPNMQLLSPTGLPASPQVLLRLVPASPNSPPLSPEQRVQAERRAEVRTQMFKKLRALPLKHAWTFYSEKAVLEGEHVAEYYARNLMVIEEVETVQMFWQVFNNTPLDLPQKSSIHFFKRGVKPLWEDPRNLHGGAWTFRIPSSYAPAFFREVLMLLIGEQLQDAITPSAASTTPTLSYASRTPISAIRPLNDDICGATYSSRFNTYLTMSQQRETLDIKRSTSGKKAAISKLLQETPDREEEEESVLSRLPQQKPEMKLGALGGGSDLLSRLNSFLPQLKAANEDLEKVEDKETLNIENIGEDEEKYIEMNLGLGVLEEKRPGEEFESDSEESGSEEEEEGEDEVDILAQLTGATKKSRSSKPAIEVVETNTKDSQKQ
ncbi:hypothetical protein G7K_0045-t1 [Saitoella complicata NRRL Y-17804]|uniref:Uncharacterized protein n=2 Tax=Saitoella complicata (strain BCRC 22490 / CBS 7301 / JCM 7358 / NBRC 10748 / NRRL Y-17804) TaxID=698492 RepID=A0A0E9N7I4_SAICN|nr:hypothetical protein G7K_0045-t1 [Saitoella complicata NRRL Y-17804]